MLELAQWVGGSEEADSEEILKNVVLKRTFWLLFRASGKRNSGLGAESPNTPLSSKAEIVEKENQKLSSGLYAPPCSEAEILKLNPKKAK